MDVRRNINALITLTKMASDRGECMKEIIRFTAR